jgi:hypothetical protein
MGLARGLGQRARATEGAPAIPREKAAKPRWRTQIPGTARRLFGSAAPSASTECQTKSPGTPNVGTWLSYQAVATKDVLDRGATAQPLLN